MRSIALPTLAACTLLSSIAAASAQVYNINSATDTFAVSFRDPLNTDAGNTTYFGWSSGTFDGGADNELMESPTPTLGVGGLAGTLDQVGSADILAGSNNIYDGTAGRSETLTLVIPTSGIVGITGFTTIVIQGLSSLGSPAPAGLTNYPLLGTIDGATPQFVIAGNSAAGGQVQWWAKYEISGNAASYTLSIGINNVGGPTVPLTVSKLTVDTQYSTTGYASDVAAVPEPSTYALLGLGLGTLLLFRRRATAQI